jgi:ubiquinone/menaquinone biosynthesis C-methylase UbiE
LNNWDEFSAFYDWEQKIINPAQNGDIDFWRKILMHNAGNVLEIACGSGRLTIPIAEAGIDITALDYSPKMIELLKQNAKNKKLKNNIKICLADMRNFNINEKFSFVLMGYFALQLLTSLREQIQCLETIYNHLKPKGLLGLDIYPCVCEGNDTSEKELLYTTEFPFDHSQITMYSSYSIDRLRLIKTWHDEYEQVNHANEKLYHNTISLVECSPSYMELLLEKCGFEIIHLYGSFDKGEVSEKSNNLLYICQKK